MASSAPGRAQQAGGLLHWLRGWLRGGDRRGTAAARALYRSAVAAARRPEPYVAWQVPDDVAARFEMVILHCLVIARAVAGLGEPGHRVAQALADTLFADMEPVLRELGVADQSIGRQLLKLAETYLARAQALDPLWEGADDPAFDAILRRNVFAERAVADGAVAALRGYLQAQARHVRAQPGEALLAGRIDWLPPLR
jgi:cytochrome b pre-mRNA-processing protein 3